MGVLICCSGCFGGTDFLLRRYYEWLVSNSIETDIVSPTEIAVRNSKKYYDIVILPSSQMDILAKLKRSGYDFQSILIWIMGCGSFRDTYYNPDRDKGQEKLVNKVLSILARKFVVTLYKYNSICFTDEVGMRVSLQHTRLTYLENSDNNIIPIAIKIPDKKFEFNKNTTSALRLCWIGRVSKDFKVIPIKHLIYDAEEYAKNFNKEIELTIVGGGDGLFEIKKVAANRAITIKFIDSIDYSEIGNYLNTHVDILIAMGTSALDGAKYGCPSVIIRPVKPSNKEIVDYRWVYESKGYSLGEYPDIIVGIEQIKKSFKDICIDYTMKDDIDILSYIYALEFDENKVFQKLYDRVLPDHLTGVVWMHLYIFSFIKGIKSVCKKILAMVNRN